MEVGLIVCSKPCCGDALRQSSSVCISQAGSMCVLSVSVEQQESLVPTQHPAFKPLCCT